MSRFKEISAADGEKAAEVFEQKCLAEGWITPKTKGGRPKDEDPFDALVREVREELNADFDAAVARDAAEQAAMPAATNPTRGRKKKGA